MQKTTLVNVGSESNSGCLLRLLKRHSRLSISKWETKTKKHHQDVRQSCGPTALGHTISANFHICWTTGRQDISPAWPGTKCCVVRRRHRRFSRDRLHPEGAWVAIRGAFSAYEGHVNCSHHERSSGLSSPLLFSCAQTCQQGLGARKRQQ